MGASEFISLGSLVVSVVALVYARSAARAAHITNEVSMREQWLFARSIVKLARRHLTPPVGVFAKLSLEYRRGYCLPLPEKLVSQLLLVQDQAHLSAEDSLRERIMEALSWNKQLEIRLDELTYRDEMDAIRPLLPSMKLELSGLASRARSELGLALELLEAKLRRGVP
jgi:hypothetical protein